MSDDEWIPFGLDEDRARDYRTLVGGVPSWLRESLISWVLWTTRSSAGGSWLSGPVFLDIQLRTDIPMPVRATESIVQDHVMLRHLQAMDEMDLLRVVDCRLATFYRGSAEVSRLNGVLQAGRSRYEVGIRGSKQGLVERAPEGVRAFVESVIDEAGAAGRLLARAWFNVHALESNDTQAYADAVRAVESVAVPVVEPNNADATLGSVAAVMYNQGDWGLDLRSHQHAPTGEMLIMMCRNLYRGHRDRHGRPDYSDVSHEEARIAVALAATLVDWFSSGAVRRAGDSA